MSFTWVNSSQNTIYWCIFWTSTAGLEKKNKSSPLSLCYVRKGSILVWYVRLVFLFSCPAVPFPPPPTPRHPSILQYTSSLILSFLATRLGRKRRTTYEEYRGILLFHILSIRNYNVYRNSYLPPWSIKAFFSRWVRR